MKGWTPAWLAGGGKAEAAAERSEDRASISKERSDWYPKDSQAGVRSRNSGGLGE